MSSQNPYQAPQAEVDDHRPHAENGELNLTGNPVSIGESLGWISSGWELFKASPGIWIANIIIFFIIMAIAGIIPLLNIIIQPIVSAVLIGGLMIGCAAIDEGESLTVNHLFAGLQQHASQLVVVGLVQLVLTIIMMVVMGFLGFLFIGGSMLAGGGLGALKGGEGMFQMFVAGFGFGFFLLMLVGIVIGFLVYSAVLFAPVLVVLHDVSPMDAIKASFSGVWKNIITFIVFGIIASILIMISAIPLGLGLLISIPVFTASIYGAYRQIFIG